MAVRELRLAFDLDAVDGDVLPDAEQALTDAGVEFEVQVAPASRIWVFYPDADGYHVKDKSVGEPSTEAEAERAKETVRDWMAGAGHPLPDDYEWDDVDHREGVVLTFTRGDIDALRQAERLLTEAGVWFDTGGGRLGEGGHHLTRDWFLDFSLEGAAAEFGRAD